MWALTSIAYRMGRTALIEELEGFESAPLSEVEEGYKKFADKIYTYSAEEAEDYFALFYGRDGIIDPGLLSQQKL